MKKFSQVRQEIASVTRQVENFRQEQLDKYEQSRKWYALPAGITVVSVLLLAAIPPLGIVGLIGAAVAFAVIYFAVVSKHGKQYKEHFKDQVLSAFVQKMYPKMRFSARSFVSEQTFRMSNIFGGFNRYSGEDYFQGQVGQIQLEFSELNVRKVSSSGTGKNRRTSTTTIFKGIFMALEHQKQVYGRVAILPDSAGKHVWFFRKDVAAQSGRLFSGWW